MAIDNYGNYGTYGVKEIHCMAFKLKNGTSLLKKIIFTPIHFLAKWMGVVLAYHLFLILMFQKLYYFV